MFAVRLVCAQVLCEVLPQMSVGCFSSPIGPGAAQVTRKGLSFLASQCLVQCLSCGRTRCLPMRDRTCYRSSLIYSL